MGLTLLVEAPPLQAPLGGPTAPLSPFKLSVFRVPVYQVWLPPEAGQQDGAPSLLQCPCQAQSHSPSLQPSGVLPACVSAGRATAQGHVVEGGMKLGPVSGTPRM